MVTRYVGGAEWHSTVGGRWRAIVCNMRVELHRPRGSLGWVAELGEPNGTSPGPSYIERGRTLRETMLRAVEATRYFVETLDLKIGGRS